MRLLEDDEAPRALPPRRHTAYPWALWRQGGWWEVVHGDDFTCKPESFITQVRTEARGSGLDYEALILPASDAHPIRIHFRFITAPS